MLNSFSSLRVGFQIAIIAADRQGLHYALSSLEQLIVLCLDDGHLPPLHIEDSPSLRMRAVVLDVSSAGRVPLLDSLFSMIDIWRSLKLNQVHLYSRVNNSAGFQWPWPYSKMYGGRTPHRIIFLSFLYLSFC